MRRLIAAALTLALTACAPTGAFAAPLQPPAVADRYGWSNPWLRIEGHAWRTHDGVAKV